MSVCVCVCMSVCACMCVYTYVHSVRNSQAHITIYYSKLSRLPLKIESGKKISRRSCFSSRSDKIKNTIYYIIIIAI